MKTKYINVEEAAARLGVVTSRVTAMCRAGKIIGAEKIGRDWVIPAKLKLIPGKRGPARRAAPVK